MKKLIAFLILVFFIATNSCYAMSELYYFKNIKTSEVRPIIDDAFELYDYNVVKQDPYYATSDNNGYAVIVLQQSGENMFYYYNSEKNSRVNKTILKELKKRNIIYEQSLNTNIISIYDDIADTLIKNVGTPIQYSFDDNNDYVQLSKPEEPQRQEIFSGYIAQITSGTKFNVYLQNAINTATASQGDSVVAVVQDGISYNGRLVIPQGSLVYGTLTKARSASYGSRSGRIVIDFNRIVTPDNYIYDISTEAIDFAVSNEGKVSESAKNAVSTAAIGALLGLLCGILADNGHAGRSAAIGAGIGAGSAIVTSVAEKGVDAEIPSFTELELTLKTPLNVNVAR